MKCTLMYETEHTHRPLNMFPKSERMPKQASFSSALSVSTQPVHFIESREARYYKDHAAQASTEVI